MDASRLAAGRRLLSRGLRVEGRDPRANIAQSRCTAALRPGRLASSKRSWALVRVASRNRASAEQQGAVLASVGMVKSTHRERGRRRSPPRRCPQRVRWLRRRWTASPAARSSSPAARPWRSRYRAPHGACARSRCGPAPRRLSDYPFSPRAIWYTRSKKCAMPTRRLLFRYSARPSFAM